MLIESSHPKLKRQPTKPLRSWLNHPMLILLGIQVPGKSTKVDWSLQVPLLWSGYEWPPPTAHSGIWISGWTLLKGCEFNPQKLRKKFNTRVKEFLFKKMKMYKMKILTTIKDLPTVDLWLPKLGQKARYSVKQGLKTPWILLDIVYCVTNNWKSIFFYHLILTIMEKRGWIIPHFIVHLRRSST